MPVKRRKLPPTAPVQSALNATPPNSTAPIMFPDQRLLKLPQAAAYLGRTVWRIRQMLHTGELRTVGPYKPYQIDRYDLDAYIEKAKAA